MGTAHKVPQRTHENLSTTCNECFWDIRSIAVIIITMLIAIIAGCHLAFSNNNCDIT